MEHAETRSAYPAPTLVVGVGGFGLAVLEHLGEDWHDLAQAGAGPTVHNLRLLSVRSAPAYAASDWRQREQSTAAVAAYVEESDQPSLALDFVILRSLGLIRFRNGSYQVAVPRDVGVGQGKQSERGGDPVEDDDAPAIERRRFFAWRDLAPDPVAAAERLLRMADRSSDLDLFVTPVLSRVRQGHSPRTLLIALARAAALMQGRDPSPWSWFRRLCDGSSLDEDGGIQIVATSPEEAARCFDAAVDLARSPEEARERFGQMLNETGGRLEGHAAEPLAGWSQWLDRSLLPDGGAAAEGPEATDPPPLELRTPAPFVPRAADLDSWFDPHRLLEMDWESSGWAAELVDSSRRPFKPSPASPFRLGLFDHDDTGSPRTRHLPPRLQQLGELAHKGLVRLWLDLQRERVEERQPVLDDRRREHDEEALRQSLEILGELLVRDLTGEGPACPAPEAAPLFGDRPSRFLQSLVIERSRPTSEVIGAVDDRLAELGLADPAVAAARHHLFHEVLMDPVHVDDRDETGNGHGTPGGLPGVRRLLNREVRHLFDLDHLTSYRTRPTRTPPRLTVLLVGDMGEPFVRAAMRPLLREVHSELLRAFTPILEYFREGFDRGLAVLPILWMPHPADPFQGDGAVAGRCEEAAIINAVHGLRRWCESVVPPTRRRVSQIFVNSRVTDVAVLDPEDSVRQTRDFITFQIRNDLARDDWLRSTAQGPRGDDFFSSFSCYEIDFPAEKAREYLANRLARDVLHRLKTAQDEEGPPAVPGELLDPPRLVGRLDDARRELLAALQPAADAMAETVRSRGRVERSTPLRELESRFGAGLERSLLDDVQRHWRGLVEDRGGMDRSVDDLRRVTSHLLSQRVVEVQRHGDELIEEHAGRGGVQAALSAFGRLRDEARRALEDGERGRTLHEQLVRRHAVPATGVVGDSRRRVLAAVGEVPQQSAMRLGLALWLVMAPALGAPLAHLLSGLLEAPDGSLAALLLGTWGWATGGTVLAGAGWLAVRLFQDHRLGRLRGAVESMAAAMRRLLVGGDDLQHDIAPSLRSFLETRLLLAAALAERGFALRIFERVEADRQLADRLDRSIDVQATVLAQQAEALGVRPTLAAGPEGTLARHPERDDVGSLFTPRSGKPIERLIPAERIVDFYRNWSGGGSEIQHTVPRLLNAAGGLERWRERACLSDTAALLGVGREEFRRLVDQPLPEQHRFADEVGERLCRFVARYYSNMGFGARFSGYEGLDPDGVQVSADATLVLHPRLAPVFEQARQDGPATTRSLRVASAPIRPSAAYMLSLAQGIRAHSVRNLRRFESFHGRRWLPEDTSFPLSGDMLIAGHDGGEASSASDPSGINHLTGFRDVGEGLHQLFRSRSRTAALPPAGGDEG